MTSKGARKSRFLRKCHEDMMRKLRAHGRLCSTWCCKANHLMKSLHFCNCLPSERVRIVAVVSVVGILVTFDVKSVCDHHGFALQLAIFATSPNYTLTFKSLVKPKFEAAVYHSSFTTLRLAIFSNICHVVNVPLHISLYTKQTAKTILFTFTLFNTITRYTTVLHV